jgi:hypothetical protein
LCGEKMTEHSMRRLAKQFRDDVIIGCDPLVTSTAASTYHGTARDCSSLRRRAYMHYCVAYEEINCVV